MSDAADSSRPDDPQHRHGHPPFSQDIQHSMVSARVPEDIGRGVFATATMIIQTQDVFVLDFISATVHPQQLVARVVLTANTFGEVIQALRINLGLYEKAYGPALLGGSVSPPPAGATAGPAGSVSPPPGAPAAGPGPSAPAAPGGGPASSPAPVVSGSSGGAGGGMPAGGAHPPQQPPQEGTQPRAEDLYDQLKLSDKMLGGSFSNAAMIRHTREDFCIDFMANFYPRAVVTARVFISAGRMLSLLDTLSGAFEKFRHRGGPGPAPRESS